MRTLIQNIDHVEVNIREELSKNKPIVCEIMSWSKFCGSELIHLLLQWILFLGLLIFS